MLRLTTFLLLLTILSCKDNKVDQKAEGEKLMQVSRDWARTATGNSVDSVMNYWADSAIFMGSDAPTIYGKADIRKMIEASLNVPGFKITWAPESASVSESGDMGYLIEKNQITVQDSTGNPFTMNGRVVTIWKKDAAGNWKNVVEASMPAK